MSLPFYLKQPGPQWYTAPEVPWYGLDLETTNVDKGDPRNPKNRIVLVCVNGTLHGDEALERLASKPCVLVAHNAKFELGWMHRYGIDLSNVLPFDTMLADYVLSGNRGWRVSLDDVAQRYGLAGKEPVVDALIKGGVCPSQIPEAWLKERVRYDVRTALVVARRQYALMEKAGLMPVFFTRCIATPMLATVEAEGLHLDKDRVEVEFAKESAQAEVSTKELEAQTGGINMRSRKQLAAYLYDTLGFQEKRDRNGEPRRTPAGARITDAETLAELKATTPEQRAFLKAQKTLSRASDRLSKSLQFFMAACLTQGGKIFGQFNQAVTATHRLSSSGKRIATPWGERGAQFQNMPREYKRLFTASALGRVLCELDYSQLEFRIAVELSGDVQGMADIASGHDVHKFTASILKNKPMDQVTAAERQDAKPHTFKPLYGGTSGTPREQAYYAAFRERYPQIAAMQASWVAEVLRTKELRTASGLIYYWPDTRVTDSGYVTNTASIYNYPVQAFATADIVLIGAVHLFWRLAKTPVRIVNTIHDSVILDMPENVTGGEVRTIANMALIDDARKYVHTVYGRELKVPLTGEYLIAPHWGDKTEVLGSGTF